MNRMFAAIFTGLAFSAAALSAGPAQAYAPDHRTVSSARFEVAALVPLSMQYFCAQNPAECRGGGAGKVTLSPDLMAVLKQVNGHVNRSIRPARDTADVWQINPASGDCEDYVLSKRSMLIRHGVPAGALRIAYTKTGSGEPHAVLVVRTSQGDYVLDNLTNSVKTVQSSGYSIRSMSSSDPGRWVAG